MLVKGIFRANLQFGNPRSYEQAVKNYVHRVETLYKGEVCVKMEDMFDETTLSLSVPNLVVLTLEKTIKNTAYLLEGLSQFAQSGKGYCAIMNEGKALFTFYIEPSQEKTATVAYQNGKQLAKEAGKEQEAITMLGNAITKFPQHWTALERRGYVQGITGNFSAAMSDFDASIAIYQHQADAYFSRARVNMMQGNLKEAITNFDIAWKNAHIEMPIYWQSRRMKATCCIKLGNYADAVVELGYFCKRNFAKNNPNYAWKKSALLDYSFALSEMKKDKEAKEAFTQMTAINDGLEPIIEGKILIFHTNMMHRLTTGKDTKAKVKAKAKVATV